MVTKQELINSPIMVLVEEGGTLEVWENERNGDYFLFDTTKNRLDQLGYFNGGPCWFELLEIKTLLNELSNLLTGPAQNRFQPQLNRWSSEISEIDVPIPTI